MVVTPTASGKTLCYNLPVIEAVRAARAKALYLFPTKALMADAQAGAPARRDRAASGRDLRAGAVTISMQSLHTKELRAPTGPEASSGSAKSSPAPPATSCSAHRR